MGVTDRRSWADQFRQLGDAYLDLSPLKGRRSGLVTCVFHADDREPSLSIDLDKAAFFCFGCGAEGGVKRFLELLGTTRPKPVSARRLEVSENPVRPVRPVRTDPPRVADLALERRLPESFLREIGFYDVVPGIRMPYRMRDGSPARAQLRLGGTPRFRWEASDLKIVPFGRDHLPTAPGFIVLVEGATDAVAAIYHHIPALGIPGAKMGDKLEAEDVEGVPQLYIVKEPGQSGESFVGSVRERLRELRWNGDLYVVVLPTKDLCDLHTTAGDSFSEMMKAAMDEAERIEP